MADKVKFDAYAVITDNIIKAIEAGVAPWRRDWNGVPVNAIMPIRANGEQYQGINVLILWIASMQYGYTSNRWFTYKQAQELGATVRKGEKGQTVCYFAMIESKKENAKGEKEKFPMLKVYTVFNAEQIDNMPEKFDPAKIVADIDTGATSIEHMEEFAKKTGARIVITGNQPCYVPGLDQIQMPAIKQFNTAESYYGTLCHELIHWTGHESRLDRLKKSGREDYAFEELVAELGACFVTSELGIDRGIDRSASYIASWLKALKEDKKYIFQAASLAQQATKYLLQK